MLKKQGTISPLKACAPILVKKRWRHLNSEANGCLPVTKYLSRTGMSKDIYTWWSKAMLAFAVPKKGMCEYAVKRGSADVNHILGYKKVIFKSDQESPIKVF